MSRRQYFTERHLPDGFGVEAFRYVVSRSHYAFRNAAGAWVIPKSDWPAALRWTPVVPDDDEFAPVKRGRQRKPRAAKPMNDAA